MKVVLWSLTAKQSCSPSLAVNPGKAKEVHLSVCLSVCGQGFSGVKLPVRVNEFLMLAAFSLERVAVHQVAEGS